MSQGPSESKVSEIVFPNMANHYGTLFGGHALKMMDVAAFIAASRHCRRTVVTVSSDKVDFKLPIRNGQLAEAIARVTSVGRTSMTVRVEMWAETLLTGDRTLCTTGEFVMVALDGSGRPTPVPPIESEERPAGPHSA